MPAKGAASPCHARVAVCLAGHPRTFPRTHVHDSLVRRLLIGMQVEHVDVFAILPTGDAPVKNQKDWNFSRVDGSVDGFWRAIAAIRPRVVLRPNTTRLDLNQRCVSSYGFLKSDPQRFLAQPMMWAACYEHIERAEREDGVAYDFVVRTRPDAYWFRPHSPLCARKDTRWDAAQTIVANGYPLSDGFPGHNDQHFVLPRAAAGHVLRMVERYWSCDGAFPHPSLEYWLAAVIRETASAHNMSVHRHRFPFVLVRNSSREPSAASCEKIPRGCRDVYPEEAARKPGRKLQAFRHGDNDR